MAAWDKLGIAVRERRLDLGLTQKDIADRGGPSAPAVRLLENNRSQTLTPRLARKLEHALQWEPGSCDAILAGGEPTPLTPQAAEPPIGKPGDRFAMARQVVGLKKTLASHLSGMDSDAREALTADVIRAAREAEDVITTLYSWLDEAERNEAIDLLVELRKPLNT